MHEIVPFFVCRAHIFALWLATSDLVLGLVLDFEHHILALVLQGPAQNCRDRSQYHQQVKETWSLRYTHRPPRSFAGSFAIFFRAIILAVAIFILAFGGISP